MPETQSHWPTKRVSQTRLGFMALNVSGDRPNCFWTAEHVSPASTPYTVSQDGGCDAPTLSNENLSAPKKKKSLKYPKHVSTSKYPTVIKGKFGFVHLQVQELLNAHPNCKINAVPI